MGVTLKDDRAPDPVPSSIAHALGEILNWQNEKFRHFGLWKRWPLHNIAFQRERLERGEITAEEFEKLREMFLAASREPVTRSKP